MSLKQKILRGSFINLMYDLSYPFLTVLKVRLLVKTQYLRTLFVRRYNQDPCTCMM